MEIGGALSFWIIISVVFLIIDMLTTGFLFVWFTIGGIAAIITFSLGFSISVQVIVFIIVSGISFAAGYPFAKKLLHKTVNQSVTMEKQLLGKVFTADKEIKEKGRLKISGIYWSVINEGECVNKGDKFKIIRSEGNKFIIKKEEEK